MISYIISIPDLEKLRKKLHELRGKKANVRHEELARLAGKMGRQRDNSRGKEPTFVNKERGWVPLSIPDHPGALKKGTVHRILNVLEEDLFWLEEHQEES